jgi:prephenate dehydratase
MNVHDKSVRTSHDESDLAPLRAAYQGIAGAYGEEAVRRAWHGRARAVPSGTFDEALDELACGRVERAVIPIANSAIGPVTPALEALDARGAAITIIREVEIPVRHCLLALPGASFDDVRFVGSHPAALAQCTRLFADRPELAACAAFDTAGAARELSMFGEPARSSTSEVWYGSLSVHGPKRLAAIASAAAARRYGLSILRAGVQDDPSNVTRFVVVRATEPRKW